MRIHQAAIFLSSSRFFFSFLSGNIAVLAYLLAFFWQWRWVLGRCFFLFCLLRIVVFPCASWQTPLVDVIFLLHRDFRRCHPRCARIRSSAVLVGVFVKPYIAMCKGNPAMVFAFQFVVGIGIAHRKTAIQNRRASHTFFQTKESPQF